MTGADIRVVTHLTTIPVNLLLIAWVGVGRTAFLPDATATVRPLSLLIRGLDGARGRRVTG